MMRINVFTLFPEVFQPYLDTSILHRAIQRQLVQVNLYNIRDWATDRHHVTDDEPYGGGGGMVMKPEPLAGAIRAAKKVSPASKTVLLTPQGRTFDQATARSYAACGGLILICGRYEGIDERIDYQFVDDEISIGDYVLAGGELPAMVFLESLVRLLPGVVGCAESVFDESHSFAMLEYPQYTRPSNYRGWRVPKVLLSGDHQRIERWRARMSLKRTLTRRPDLLAGWRTDQLSQEMHKRLEEALGDD